MNMPKRICLIFLCMLLSASQLSSAASIEFLTLEFRTLNVNIFLRAARESNEVKFDGKSLVHTYDDGQRIFTVVGQGEVHFSGNTIRVSNEDISLNGTKIEIQNGRVNNFVLDKDGSLHPGFLRTFD